MSEYINPRDKVLWHTDHLQQIKDYGRTQAPINVEIDLSNRCSLGCEWCHFAHTHTRGPWAGKAHKASDAISGGDLMPVELATRILTQLAEAGVQSVTWSGGGEPTLHPHFDDIVTYAAHVGLPQGLYTHGGHISAERAALLKRHLTWVYVSLDEYTADAYKQSKGVDGYGRVIDGITNLVNAEGNATIGVGFLLHRNNCNDIDGMVSLARLLNVDYVQFRPTIRYKAEAPGQVDEDTAWVGDAVQRLAPHANDSFVIADLKRFAEYAIWRGHEYTTCNWTALQTVITPNGKVWRCVNKREHTSALMGDLTQDTFAYIWQRHSGPCAVDGACRVMCRGNSANITLDAVLTQPKHAAFV